MRASGRSGRGLKKPSDKVLESPVFRAGYLSANQGGETSSALHMRLGRLAPADNIKRACKNYEPRGRDKFFIVKPLSMAMKEQRSNTPSPSDKLLHLPL